MVYIGEYNGKAVKYRVLDVNTTEYSAQEGGVKAPTMLLESTEELWIDKFDDRGREWAESYIKVFLNSEDGYSDTGFLTSAFSGVEKNAIASSVKSTASDEDGEGMSLAGYAPLTGEKIFLLDAKEATRTGYGYSNTNQSAVNRLRDSTSDLGKRVFWYRSSFGTHVCASFQKGEIAAQGSTVENSIVPALNVDLSSVLFTSKLPDECATHHAAHKLTLIDDNIKLSLPMAKSSVTRDGDEIRVRYNLSNQSEYNIPNRISVLILDKEWTRGNSNNASVLAYDTVYSDTASYVAYTLPVELAGKECGKDYYAYIVAEDINSGASTDYASEPVALDIPNRIKFNAPTVYNINIGATPLYLDTDEGWYNTTGRSVVLGMK